MSDGQSEFRSTFVKSWIRISRSRENRHSAESLTRLAKRDYSHSSKRVSKGNGRTRESDKTACLHFPPNAEFPAPCHERRLM